MKRPRGSDGSHEEALNITPMIDVVFLLLIFFIATMRLPEPEAGLRAYLPKDDPTVEGAADDPEDEQEIITIKITLEPSRILWNDQPVPNNFAGLRDRLALTRVEADKPNASTYEIVLDAAASVPYRLVIKTLEVCSGYKFDDVNFAMPPAAQPGT